MMGLFQAKAKVLAVSTPIRSEPIKPGPTVTAIASISGINDCFIVALFPPKADRPFDENC